MTTKVPPQGYHDLAKVRDFEWLGPYLDSVDKSTVWRCLKGHEWPAKYSKIREGSGCPHCAGTAPKSEQDYLDLAQARGFEWIGDMPKDITFNTRWCCQDRHKWQAPYTRIARGQGCRECHLKTVRILPQGYHDLANGRGFEWLGPNVTNNHHLTTWCCLKGHRWSTSYKGIKRGHGCPHCLKVSENDYLDIANVRGFEWLGPYLGAASIPTNWRCSKGHEWKARYDSVLRGSGCPHCNLFKGPSLISETLEAMGVHFYLEKRFPTCCNKSKLPFDFYVPTFKLLIEYQGEQHFEPIEYYGGYPKLVRRQHRDAIKNLWAIENGYEILYINCWQYDHIAEILADRLQPKLT